MATKSAVVEWGSSLFYSFVLFSTFSFKIFALGEMYLFEAAVASSIIYCAVFKDRVGGAFVGAFRRRRRVLFFALFTMLVLALVGCFTHGDVAEAYTDLRANMFVVVGAALGGVVLQHRSEVVFKLAISTIFWSITYWVVSFLSGTLSTKFATPLFAGVMAVIIASDQGRLKATMISLLGLIFLAAVSFFRQYWIIAVIVAVMAVLQLLRGGAKRVGAALALVAGVAFAVLVSSGFVSELFNSNDSLYIQSIGKTNDLLEWMNGGSASDSDNLRASYFIYMWEQFVRLLIPHGLGAGANAANFDPWFYSVSDASSTIDSLLLFLAYHYGYLILIPLFGWFVWTSLKVQLRRGALRAAMLFAVLAVPLLLDGGQATVTVRAFWFGMFCAYLMTPSVNQAFVSRHNGSNAPLLRRDAVTGMREHSDASQSRAALRQSVGA
jgi:hypothetical protein